MEDLWGGDRWWKGGMALLSYPTKWNKCEWSNLLPFTVRIWSLW